MKKKGSFLEKDGTQSVLASLLSILIGLLVGAVLILIVGFTSKTLSPKAAWEGIRLVILGIFSTGRDASGALTFGFNPVHLGNMLFRAMPLILTGLSVAVSFKTGLFNIGAPGQYLAGTAASLFIALRIPTTAASPEYLMAVFGTTELTLLPTGLVWLLAFLGGMLAGAVWGAIPGMLKAYLNINEVLACIMTNWIGANLVTWAFDVSTLKNMLENTKSAYVYKTYYNGVVTPKLGLDKIFPGSQVNGGILIAILFAVIVYIIFSRTTFGYELTACGANRHAARYAGIKDRRNIVLSMAIAGALAAAAGSLYSLSGNTEFYWATYQSLPSTGFNGIPVALLAVNNPIAVIFTGMFMSMLNIAGQQLTSLTAYNEFITDVIIAVIVYLSAFSLVIKIWLADLSKKKKAPVQNEKPAGAEPEKEAEA